MKKIIQIEFTNHCNRRCDYCGIPRMQREKGFLEESTLRRCIEILKQIDQKTVGIHHFGESLMHPELIRFIEILNENEINPYLYTNGDFLTDERIEQLGKVRLDNLVISGHAPKERRIKLWEKTSAVGIKSYWQTTVKEQAINMAGQLPIDYAVDKDLPPLSDPMTQCRFLVEQWACVLWNGDLVACCIDYEGLSIFGNIHDPEAISLKPVATSICDKCPGHPGNVI